MKNKLLLLLGYILMVLGVLLMFSPIPGSIFLLAGGLTLLICTDPLARFCVKWMRIKMNWFNKFIGWIEIKIGVRIKFMGDALSLTRPNADEMNESLSHSEYLKKQHELHKDK